VLTVSFRKDWKQATVDMFVQQERDEQEELMKSEKGTKKAVEISMFFASSLSNFFLLVRPVSLDWANSLIYVVPNGEFTQESNF